MIWRFVSLLVTLPIVGMAVFPSGLAHGQSTRLWSQSNYAELERGKPNGVAITSDGQLVAGPSSALIATTPSTYVWAVSADKTGNAYLATGGPATVLRVSPDGKATKMFSSHDLNVQTVRVGPNGAIYAATLPSGKVYRLDPSASGLTEDTASVAFDPTATEEKPKYVWDLAFDSEGRLYIATGGAEGGTSGIYRVNVKAPGKPELFFKSDEQHVRTMAFDSTGDLIAGSDGSGLVYRIDKSGKGYVVFDATKSEITSIAVGPNGTIYAAAVGEKGRNTLPPLPVTGTATVTIKVVQPGSVNALSGNTVIPDGSEIDEIAPNGTPRKLWEDHDDVVYALRWTPHGLLAATGNRGRIYRINEDGSYADIAHLEGAQATGFADSARGTFVSTANSGKLYLLSHGDAPQGTYLSDAFDAGVFSQWGRAEVNSVGGADSFDLFARTGNINNPERAWSDWKKVTPNVGSIGLAARFVQWKAVLRPGAAIDSVGIDYLPVNVAPVVDEVMVESGARVNAAPMEATPQQVAINFPAPRNPTGITFAAEPGREPLVGLRDRSAVTVRWIAHDENGDRLEYSVYYRGEGEHNWQLLKKNVRQTFLSFDAQLLPDGHYRLKVVASDALSHDPGQGLTGEKVSPGFLIDTTPPVVSGMSAQLVNKKVHVAFTATDTTSPISHAEYSVDAGPWQYVAPVGNISDSLTEKFDFDAPLKPRQEGAPVPTDPQEHVITVRVYDRPGNVIAAKALVR